MEEHDQDLVFKPITSGLGFHPFSDGFPYAPQVRKAAKRALDRSAMSSGAGATAAGIPLYRPPTIAPPQPVHLEPSKAVSVHAPKIEFAQLIRDDVPYRLAAKRAASYLLDTLVNSALGLGALSAAMWFQGINARLLFNPGVFAVLMVFLAVFSWAVVSAQEIVLGTSAGKWAFGLFLEGSGFRVFARAVLFGFTLFSVIGIVWALFDGRRRCWHDLLSGIEPHEAR